MPILLQINVFKIKDLSVEGFLCSLSIMSEVYGRQFTQKILQTLSLLDKLDVKEYLKKIFGSWLVKRKFW